MAAETTTQQPPAATVPAVAAPPKAPLVSGGRVGAIIPTDIEQVFRLASAIAAAEWAPKSYMVDSRKPDLGYDKNKIVVGIMQGMEVGLSPMAALQSIAVINGMPSLWGDGLLAVVRASGQMVDIKEDMEFAQDGSPAVATCTVWRAGQKTPVQRMFTRAQAQKAGLWSKQGPWTQYPQRMMQMRARAWALRDAFTDVLRGLRSAEEAEDTPRDITPVAPEPRRADFATPAGGGYDPADATPARPTIIDAQDESAGEPVDAGATDAQPEQQAAAEPEGPYAPADGWPKFAKFSEFEEYATDFLAQATAAQAIAWNAQYAQTLQHYMTKGSDAQKEAVATLLKAYGDLTRDGDLPSKSAV